VQVRIQNVSGAVLNDVAVTFDASYLDHFSRLTFTPPLTLPHAVELSDLHPGSTSVVRLEFEGDRPWWGRGRIGVAYEADTTAALISTFTFP
jgi:hypothetical protein